MRLVAQRQVSLSAVGRLRAVRDGGRLGGRAGRRRVRRPDIVAGAERLRRLFRTLGRCSRRIYLRHRFRAITVQRGFSVLDRRRFRRPHDRSDGILFRRPISGRGRIFRRFCFGLRSFQVGRRSRPTSGLFRFGRESYGRIRRGHGRFRLSRYFFCIGRRSFL